MEAERVMEVLGRVEWVGGYSPYCLWCYRWKTEGHSDDCKLDALLREGEKEKADKEVGQRR